MTDDIAARLRNMGLNTTDDAADEIESLRETNARLNRRCGQYERAIAEKIRDKPRGGLGKALLSVMLTETEAKLERVEAVIEKIRALEIVEVMEIIEEYDKDRPE